MQKLAIRSFIKQIFASNFALRKTVTYNAFGCYPFKWARHQERYLAFRNIIFSTLFEANKPN